MRTVITYSLLFLFSLAFSYETITYFSKKISDGFQTAVNDCEAESDTESDDEKEKKGPLEDFCFLESSNLELTTHLQASCLTDFIFSSSDYSQTIYSPPELILL